MRKRVGRATLLWLPSVLLCLLALVLLRRCLNNNPWPASLSSSNTSFQATALSFKSLNTATSYYEHELRLLCRMVEMPYEYHYLREKATPVPMLAESMPVLRYFGKDGQVLPGDPPAEQVSKVEVDIALKKGVLYQPHPCFAVDGEGRHIYLQKDAAVPSVKSPMDFPHQGTREMVAEDFRVALVRLCDPSVSSPVYSTFKSFIQGMDSCSAAIAAKGGTAPDYRSFQLEGVQTTGSHGLRLILSRKYPQLLYWMTLSFFAPVPWEAIEFYRQPRIRATGLSQNFWPVGTGAYMLKEFTPDSRIIQVRNPNHRQEFYPSDGDASFRQAGLLEDAGKPLPFIDTIYTFFEKEAIPTWIKFTQGYYDTNGIPNDVCDNTLSIQADGGMGLSQDMKDKGVSLLLSPNYISYYYAFNMMDDVYGGLSTSHKKLRQAISIVLDAQEFADTFLNSRGIEAHSILPPGISGGDVSKDNYNRVVFDWDDTRNAPRRKSLDAARKLMEEAGYPCGVGPDGKKLTLSYDHASAGRPSFKAQFQWLKGKMALLGIDLLDNGTDQNRFRDKMTTGNWQFLYKGWVADYPDSENFLFLFYGPNAHVPSHGKGPNYSNYVNPRYDALFKKLETMRDSPERLALIRQAVELLREDAPCVWSHTPVNYTLVQPWVKNYRPHPLSLTTSRFQRLDVDLRNQLQHQWN